MFRRIHMYVSNYFFISIQIIDQPCHSTECSPMGSHRRMFPFGFCIRPYFRLLLLGILVLLIQVGCINCMIMRRIGSWIMQHRAHNASQWASNIELPSTNVCNLYFGALTIKSQMARRVNCKNASSVGPVCSQNIQVSVRIACSAATLPLIVWL